MLAPLNSTMIAVALPDIRGDYGIGRHEVAWLITSYLIVMAAVMPLGGRLGDAAGRGRVFRAGLLVFLAASLAAAAAPDFFPLLVLFRCVQACSGAVLIPNGMAMLRSTAPKGRFGEANGIVGALIGIAASAGPLLGGALLELGSWRLAFLASVPLTLAALLLQARLAISDSPAPGRFQADWVAAALFVALLGSLSFMIGNGGSGLNTVVPAIGVFVVLAMLFIRRQTTSAHPLAEWSSFRNQSFAASTGFVLLSNIVMYSTLLAVPFFLKEVQRQGDAAIGVALGAMSILSVLLAPFSGRLSDRHGRRLPAVAGSLCVLAGTVLMLRLSSDTSLVYISACLALIGLGLGLGSGPATAAALESGPIEKTGVASGTVSMVRYIGSIAGAAALGLVLREDEAPSTKVFTALFAALAVTASLTTAISTRIHQFAPSSRRNEAGKLE